MKFVYMVERHIKDTQRVYYVVLGYVVAEETKDEYVVIGDKNVMRKMPKRSWQFFESYAEASAYATKCQSEAGRPK